ncbi:MAG: ATP-binding cassette domain-containing protein, partial [Flavitalea sp.]
FIEHVLRKLILSGITEIVVNVHHFSEQMEEYFSKNDLGIKINLSIEKEILNFHEKFETMVGERGVTLSGGQKQRISIARGLIKDPKVIIFDDCLSAVDARTEKDILSNLTKFLNDRTAIIITHRILPFFKFDKIVVLEEGKIIEQGTHQELLQLNGHYTFLYQQQRREEEPS